MSNAVEEIQEPATPECDKLRAIKDQSQAIGEFLEEFLAQEEITLCKYREAGDNGKPEFVWKEGVKKSKQRNGAPIEPGDEPDRIDYLNEDAERNPDYEEWSAGFYPVHIPTEQLLAKHFGIDLKKVEQEKLAVLEYIRSRNQT